MKSFARADHQRRFNKPMGGAATSPPVMRQPVISTRFRLFFPGILLGYRGNIRLGYIRLD